MANKFARYRVKDEINISQEIDLHIGVHALPG